MIVFPLGKIDGEKPGGIRNIKSAIFGHGAILYPNDAPPNVGTSYLAHVIALSPHLLIFLKINGEMMLVNINELK